VIEVPFGACFFEGKSDEAGKVVVGSDCRNHLGRLSTYALWTMRFHEYAELELLSATRTTV
jgi:hypothetical protein